jgi:uncharacterized protein (DUF433 family)
MASVSDIHTVANGLVVSDTGILGGKPVFRGTRLPVQSLFDYLADGLSLDYFLETFPAAELRFWSCGQIFVRRWKSILRKPERLWKS